MRFQEVSEGVDIIREGDIGDALYIILDGTCVVSIKETVVSELSAGCSFGEKALDNDALRSATISSASKCKLLVIYAVDYRNIALCAQMISTEKRAQV